ncbi:glycosyltransferase family 2 protein [Novosphingobium sp.]|uniref:glycosyltransferase family 2 protein n=1 Tax=Novosphingobium sp. TaxID=1874826 RepID=UPI003BAD566D
MEMVSHHIHGGAPPGPASGGDGSAWSQGVAPLPRVSVVLPVHNGAAYLDAAIGSILGQTFRDFELICVDDGSTDETPSILRRHAQADGRVRIITNRPNKGLPGALNTGFAAARGMLHTWTSDDNIARPHMLARLVAALDADPGVAIAYADFSVIDANGAVIGCHKMGPACDLLLGNRIGAAFLYRAEVTKALSGYDEALFGVEDYDFWLRASRRFYFVKLDEDLYLYRRHEASLTGRRALRIHRLGSQVIRRELARVPSRTLRARALVEHGLASRLDPRLDMLVRGLILSPGLARGRITAILRHCVHHLVRALTRRTG